MADQRKYQPPWSWRYDAPTETEALCDARGVVLLSAEEVFTRSSLGDPQMTFASPYVRAATEAAGEMDHDLRELAEHDRLRCLRCLAGDRCAECAACRLSALLARIDERANATVVEPDPKPEPPVCAHCNVPQAIVEDPPGYERWRCQFAGCPGHYWDRQPCWGEMHVYRAADPDALWAPAPRPSMACSGHIDAFRSEHPHSNHYKAKGGDRG